MVNPFKLILDIVRFFVEVYKASHTDGYAFVANENWWLTKSVIAHEKATGMKARSACSFFWTAMLMRPLYRLSKFTGHGDGEKGFIILVALLFLSFGTLVTWSLTGFILSLLITIFWLVMITWTIRSVKKDREQNKPREVHEQTTLGQDFDNWLSALGEASWWFKPVVLVRGLVAGVTFATAVVIVVPIWFVVLVPLGWLFNLLKNNYCPMVSYSPSE